MDIVLSQKLVALAKWWWSLGCCLLMFCMHDFVKEKLK